jgi:2-polyprenyl-6-hydroxyphenyl methylase / 3-demethylubiquinone-9 3-methyltransferase
MSRQRRRAEKPATDGLSSTRDEAEIARFDAMASTWWDEAGPMAVLHRFNPVRVAWIRDCAIAHFGLNARSLAPLEGLDLVDIGCGGGILSEPMARLGAHVTGLDPAPGNVVIARGHAAQMGLGEDEGGPVYRESTIEDLVAEGRRFDIVLAMEVIEHVADPQAFVNACAAAVKPGGLMIMATLNRTLRSFALAIVGAEYVLRWLPRGTHQWDRFITPDELSDMIARTGLAVTGEGGVVFNPLSGEWSLSGDLSVNYMLSATRSQA